MLVFGVPVPVIKSYGWRLRNVEVGLSFRSPPRGKIKLGMGL